MISSTFFAVVLCAISAHASIYPIGLSEVVVSPGIATGTILQGPSSRATVLGPDGGLIKARADGAAVLTNRGALLDGPAIVPVLAKSPTVVVAGPAAPGGVIIAGPSGTVATGNGVGKSIVPLVTRVVSVPQYGPGPVLGLGLGGLSLGGIGLEGGLIGHDY